MLTAYPPPGWYDRSSPLVLRATFPATLLAVHPYRPHNFGWSSLGSKSSSTRSGCASDSQRVDLLLASAVMVAFCSCSVPVLFLDRGLVWLDPSRQESPGVFVPPLPK